MRRALEPSSAAPILVAVVLCATTACAALADDLQRAERTYEQARYEEALVWLSDLESDTADMTNDQRARFYYLRGMTSYRLSQRDDALHFLALARETAGEHTDALRPEWQTTLEATLSELIPDTRTHRARTPGQPAQEASAGGEEPATEQTTP